MSKRLEKLLAAKPECEEDENKPAPEEAPAAAEDEPEKPADPAPETPAKPAPETPADPAPEAPADGDDPDDPDDDDEDKPATRGALAMLERRLDALVADNSRLRAENAKLGEDVGRLRAMLRDPSYAAAAASATPVPAASDAAPTLTREAADAAYAKLRTARERAAYRKAHRAELGLR